MTMAWKQIRRLGLFVWLLFFYSAGGHAAKLSFEIQNEEGRLLPSRIHLFDQTEKPQKAAGLPFWHDHFVCPGTADLELPTGRYRYEIERGPEYERLKGQVAISNDSPQSVSYTHLTLPTKA